MCRLFLIILLLISVSASPAAGQAVIVDGTSNTLLVGETGNPSAPPGIPVKPGARLRFSCSGSVQTGAGFPFYGADGGSTGGYFGTANTRNICGISAPWGSLVGVFVGDAILLTPTPLDYWSDPESRNFTRQNPGIQQPFVIGDGASNTLLIQETVVPPGATHLYLGVHDSGNWGENAGAFTVNVTPMRNPSVIVDGTSNTLLVGETGNPSAPPGIPVHPGARLRFSCSGSIQVDAGGQYYGADGGSTGGYFYTANSRNIGGLSAPWGSLVGVFVGDAILPTPPPLDYWSDPDSRNFTRQNPGIQQPFVIGDGASNTLLLQETVVPPGATHLYLGVHDSGNWGENSGAFSVVVMPRAGNAPVIGALLLAD